MTKKSRMCWNTTMEETVFRMWNSGKTTGQIALKLGVTRGQVSGQIAFMRRRGITMQIRLPERIGVQIAWTHWKKGKSDEVQL